MEHDEPIYVAWLDFETWWEVEIENTFWKELFDRLKRSSFFSRCGKNSISYWHIAASNGTFILFNLLSAFSYGNL